MKTLVVYQTFDGQTHTTMKDATKHLDKIYGDLILKLSRDLVPKNYTETSEYIDANLDSFLKLKVIKDDMILLSDDDDSDDDN